MAEEYDEKMVLKESGVSVVKILLSGLPGIGTIIDEAVFEAPNRIRQANLNSLTIKFKECMNSIKEENIDYNYISSDDFGVLIYLICKKAEFARSHEKIFRYARILALETTNHYQSDFKETFLDIVSKINEDQILILSKYRKAKISKKSDASCFSEVGVLDGGGSGDDEKPEVLPHRRPEHYGLDKEKYLFYIQDLISKSLMYDDSVGRFGSPAFEVLDITDFGCDFLSYIEGHYSN